MTRKESASLVEANVRAVARLDRALALVRTYGPHGTDAEYELDAGGALLVGWVITASLRDLKRGGCPEVGIARVREAERLIASAGVGQS